MSVNENLSSGSELDCFKAELSAADFKIFSNYIYSEFGIKMPEVKRVMLQGRLLKRIRQLKMSSYSEYKEYFFSKEGQQKELYNFLSVVTTNKTDFFREPVHFDFLSNTLLPEMVNEQKKSMVKIWSAACSSGEEPYTISIVLNEFKEEHPQIGFSILGTDISLNVLDKAAKGIYAEKEVELMPLNLKKKYFLRSKDRKNPTVKVQPILQKNISLQYLNLMDSVYDLKDTFDVIFCRNVLIYFDRETQEKVINKLCERLIPGGYLFIGHSESVANMNVPLINIKPTIFKRK
ncbi:MAG: protein-glutamate O-methyltransferase CheR [Marinilabiliaceae bacterium]|jgi:chemotaxis protein methyltransferase CheR|nr:protein-glutamate O-methyltransferase CheR [Bacteroidales bacterium]MCR5697443.1 protein-glutamate O-methyltransferase CheR [Marinilabiliaceae bacterium]